MKKRISIIFVLLFSISTVAGAWGWGGLKPGDHVIDYKRLADSIRETAHMLLPSHTHSKTFARSLQTQNKPVHFAPVY